MDNLADGFRAQLPAHFRLDEVLQEDGASLRYIYRLCDADGLQIGASIPVIATGAPAIITPKRQAALLELLARAKSQAT